VSQFFRPVQEFEHVASQFEADQRAHQQWSTATHDSTLAFEALVGNDPEKSNSQSRQKMASRYCETSERERHFLPNSCDVNRAVFWRTGAHLERAPNSFEPKQTDQSSADLLARSDENRHAVVGSNPALLM